LATGAASFARSRLEAAFAPLPMVADWDVVCVLGVGGGMWSVELCGGGCGDLLLIVIVDRDVKASELYFTHVLR